MTDEGEAPELPDVAQEERALIEQLRERNMMAVWNQVKVGLACEQFFDTRVGKAIITRLNAIILDGQEAWLLQSDVNTEKMREAHLNARAAHMAIATIDSILSESADAEEILNQMERDDG